MLSPKSAGLAAKNGYSNVMVNRAGDPGWKEEELPLEASAQFVKEGNRVLVDLRDAERVRQGYLPGAVNIPAARLGSMEAAFPADHGAPIVFYGDDPAALEQALEYMADWGYPNASRFPNALETWQDRGWELATGPAVETPTYVRKLGPNEVSAEQFLAAVESGAALIVDARSKDEYDSGAFGGALNVPAEEAGTRYAEIPSDRPALIHCSTGSRAEMLFDILAGKGYQNVKYLVAHVEFDAAGKAKVVQ